MRQICFGLLGIMTCTALSLKADSFNVSDLLAGKDFPFPPDESDLPENMPTEDSGNSSSSGQSQQSEKKIAPEVQQGKPKTGKDIFPPESEKQITPEVQQNKPRMGKDIFPPESE